MYKYFYNICDKSILFKTPLKSMIKYQEPMQMSKQSSSIGEYQIKNILYSYIRHATTQISMYGSTQVQPPTITCKMQIMYNNKINNTL